MSYFPMFVELKNQPCLVVGGGNVALRKAMALKDFGAKVTVEAPAILTEIKEMEGVICLEKEFTADDIAEWSLVVAATDDAVLNSQVSQLCRNKKVPVNAVDQIEDCSFIFPAYLKEGEVVAAFSSGGQSPSIAQYLKSQMKPAMTPLIGELAGCLGNIREIVKQCTQSEYDRKKIYQEILKLALDKDALPSEEEIRKTIQQEGSPTPP